MRIVRGAGGLRVLSPEESAARRRAAEIVAGAEAAAEGIRQAARADGRAEGRAEAAAVLAGAAAVEARWQVEHRDAVVSLACAVASVVLGREAAGGTEVVRDVTVGVLARARRARGVVLRVHPDEAPAVRAAVASWLVEGTAPEVLGVEADPAVGRGGVIADTEIGRLDGRLEVQLQTIARALAAEAPKR